MLVFGLVFLTYFLFLGGVIYDVITDMPSVGQTRDPYTGAIKPQAILPGRINGQYIIEGLSASFMFSLGGIGVMLLESATSKKGSPPKKNAFFRVVTGTLLLLVAYNVCVLFIRIKVPNYLR